MVGLESAAFEAAEQRHWIMSTELERAMLLGQQGFHVEAAAIYSQLAANATDENERAKYLFCEASSQAQAGRFAEAKLRTKEADDAAATDPAVRAMIAYCWGAIAFAEHRYAEACQQLSRVLTEYRQTLAEEDYDWLRCECEQRLAFALFEIGQFSKALDILERISGLCEEDADSKLYLARIKAKMGNPVEAEKLIRELIAENPQLPKPHFDLGYLLLEQHRFQEAKSEFNCCLDFPPTWFLSRKDIFEALADVSMQQGELDEAARYADLAERSRPH